MNLAQYGTPTHTYTGSGTLRHDDGSRTPCEFEAGQLPHGDVIILTSTSAVQVAIAPAVQFVGTTSGGDVVDARLDPLGINILPRPGRRQTGSEFAHRASKLRVSRPQTSPSHTLRYGLVNFRFSGTNQFIQHEAGTPIRGDRQLSLQLQRRRGSIDVVVEPIPDYHSVALRLTTLRDVALTCETVLDSSTLPPAVKADDVMSDLCLVMSLARGTLVQWVYRRELDATGHQCAITHVNHITRPFNSLAALDHRLPARADTKRFMEGAYASLPQVSIKYAIRRGLISAYVDSRGEDDFLEFRGLKVAALAEMVKTQGSTRKDGRSFHDRLAVCCRRAGFHPTDADLSDFVESRNRLVHAGRFRSDPKSRHTTVRFQRPVDEYFFMISFLDRFFLKLFGYSGLFVEWAQFPNHENGHLP